MNSNIILGIEAAIEGGSLAILQGESVVHSVRGGVSRSEEIVVRIDEIVREADLRIQEISTIAVSIGPGSFTGIRIAIATAIGLARAVKGNCGGVSLFEAIASSANSDDCGVIISLGRGYFGSQRFVRHNGEIRAVSNAAAMAESEVRSLLEADVGKAFYLCGTGSVDAFSGFSNTFEVGRNLAELIVLHATATKANRLNEPLYLGK